MIFCQNPSHPYVLQRTRTRRRKSDDDFIEDGSEDTDYGYKKKTKKRTRYTYSDDSEASDYGRSTRKKKGGRRGKRGGGGGGGRKKVLFLMFLYLNVFFILDNLISLNKFPEVNLKMKRIAFSFFSHPTYLSFNPFPYMFNYMAITYRISGIRRNI